MDIASEDAIKIHKAMCDLCTLLGNQEAVENGNPGLPKSKIREMYNNAKNVMYEVQGEI